MKKVFGILIILVMVGLTSGAYAASQSYTVSVTIPAIVGVNVPHVQTQVQEVGKTEFLAQREDVKNMFETLLSAREEMVVETLVMK